MEKRTRNWALATMLNVDFSEIVDTFGDQIRKEALGNVYFVLLDSEAEEIWEDFPGRFDDNLAARFDPRSIQNLLGMLITMNGIDVDGEIFYIYLAE